VSIHRGLPPITEHCRQDMLPSGAGCWSARSRQAVGDMARRLAGGMALVLRELMGTEQPGSFGQLLYHRVVPTIPGLAAPTMNVRPTRFVAQLEGLMRQGFQFRPLADLLEAVRSGRNVSQRTATVTFDDGFESVYRHAWPVLQRLRIPCTIFLSTVYLDGEDPFFFDDWALAHFGRIPASCYRPLRRSQCLEMAASGLVSFGAHLHTHGDFRGRPAAFQQDLRQSVSIVSEMFAVDVDDIPFSFPFGKSRLGFVDEELVAAARRVGVCCGLTTDSVPVRPGTDPFTWGRINVYDWDTPDTLSAKMSGWYGWLDARGTRFKRPFEHGDAGPSVEQEEQVAT
jgi:peptidoglycan/xylan/chitin deacetylase (PgdA/CDA1 family)